MDVSNLTDESTAYRVTAIPGGMPAVRQGNLKSEIVQRNISLPSATPVTIEFYIDGKLVACETFEDPSIADCLITLEKKYGRYYILVSRPAEDHNEDQLRGEGGEAKTSKHQLKDYNEERLELLARKYGGVSFTVEDEARLEALTERVRHLLPRVTREDWQRLEEMELRFNEIQERARAIRRKYGLNG